MAKASYAGPSEKLELYETLVDSVEGVERKGAANPYTSRNGYMTSFIDILERHDEIRELFARSWEWVGTKKPK